MPDVRYLPAHGRRMNEAMLWALKMEFPLRDGQLFTVDGHHRDHHDPLRRLTPGASRF
jgi:hypothetical protein